MKSIRFAKLVIAWLKILFSMLRNDVILPFQKAHFFTVKTKIFCIILSDYFTRTTKTTFL